MSALMRVVCSLSVSALLGAQLQAQTVVDSVFTPTEFARYSDPQNWSPPEVPDNSALRSYNVTVPYSVEVDTRAQVSKFEANGVWIQGMSSLTVTESATIGSIPYSPDHGHNRSGLSLIAGGVFSVEGTLTNFDAATRTLTGGEFYISGYPYTDTTFSILRFPGADIVRNASSITIEYPLARILDEKGRDGLRNFAHNMADGHFSLFGTDFTTSGDFTNDGVLGVSGEFTISGTLTNFDPATRTLTSGVYGISSFGGSAGGKLTFNGADIVRNAATIRISGNAMIADENGNNALRNLASNESGGFFQPNFFTAAGDFENAGTVWMLYPFTVPGRYVQTGGETFIYPGALTGAVEINGGSLSGTATFHTGIPRITGNLTVRDALITVRDLRVTGAVRFEDSTRARIDQSNFDNFNSGPMVVNGPITLAGTLEIEDPGQFSLPSGTVIRVIRSSGRTGTFSNAPQGTRVPTTNGRGSFIVSYEGDDVLIGAYQRIPPAAQLMNISTRAEVGTGEHVAIAGFIISGPMPKKVILRGLGPSIVLAGFPSTLSDPTLALHGPTGALIATNDNWQDTQEQEIRDSGVAPEHERESAIVATLPAGAYTVILRNQSPGTPAHGLVEIFDLAPGATSKLGNISTRGHVSPGALLIGGLIAGGNGEGSAELTVRAVGPGLSSAGVPNPLPDPTLQIFDRNGVVVAENDDHGSVQGSAGRFHPGLYPRHQKDAAIGVILPPGEYTAVVRGKNDDSGIALVEVFDHNL